MRTLNVRDELDLGHFKRPQINLRDAFIGFVVDPKPMPVIASLGLAQHWMMGVAPERAGGRQAFVRFRGGIIGVAKGGTRFKYGNFLDEPAGRNAIDEYTAALPAAQKRVVVVQLAGRHIDLLGGGCRLLRRFLLPGRGVRVAAREHERHNRDKRWNKFESHSG